MHPNTATHEETVMKKLFFAIAIGMALFMDFAVGASIAAVLASILGVTPEWWHLVGGAVLGVLPDFDLAGPIIYRAWKEKPVEGDHHEYFTHLPLLMVPAATLVFSLLGDSYWGLLAFFCVSMHYLHDASNMLPEDRLRWLFRLRRKLWSLEGKKDPTWYELGYWINTFWLRPSRLSVREMGIAAIATGITTYVVCGFYFPDAQYAATVSSVLLVYGGAVVVWALYDRLKPYL